MTGDGSRKKSVSDMLLPADLSKIIFVYCYLSPESFFLFFFFFLLIPFCCHYFFPFSREMAPEMTFVVAPAELSCLLSSLLPHAFTCKLSF